jgi:hypothetical protein
VDVHLTASRVTFTGRRAISLRFTRKAAAALRRSASTPLTLRVDATDGGERVAVRTIKLRIAR